MANEPIVKCHPSRKHYAKGLCKLCYTNKLHKEMYDKDPLWRKERLKLNQKNYEKNPERYKARHKAYWKKNRKRLREQKILALYNLSPEKYAELLAKKGGGCWICGKIPKQGKRLQVDHDHACCPGKKSCGNCIRGMLCTNCNHGLGNFLDCIDLLIKAEDYLKMYDEGNNGQNIIL